MAARSRRGSGLLTYWRGRVVGSLPDHMEVSEGLAVTFDVSI